MMVMNAGCIPAIDTLKFKPRLYCEPCGALV